VPTARPKNLSGDETVSEARQMIDQLARNPRVLAAEKCAGRAIRDGLPIDSSLPQRDRGSEMAASR